MDDRTKPHDHDDQPTDGSDELKESPERRLATASEFEFHQKSQLSPHAWEAEVKRFRSTPSTAERETSMASELCSLGIASEKPRHHSTVMTEQMEGKDEAQNE